MNTPVRIASRTISNQAVPTRVYSALEGQAESRRGTPDIAHKKYNLPFENQQHNRGGGPHNIRLGRKLEIPSLAEQLL